MRALLLRAYSRSSADSTGITSGFAAENRRTETEKAAEARRNYLEARAAIQTMLGRLDDGRVAGSPRLIDLRRDLRQDALAFYDQILHQVTSTDPVVLADTIRAMVEATHMHYVLGDRPLAESTIRRAFPLISTLRSLGGDELECLGLEVDCLMKLGAAIEVPARRGEAVSYMSGSFRWPIGSRTRRTRLAGLGRHASGLP